MPRPKKPLHELETEEVMRHIFHKDAVKHLKKTAHAPKPKPKPRRSRSILESG